MRRLLQISLSLALLLIPSTIPSALAATITGTVTNGTTNKPSDGDDVILISLQQRMQEAARTKTDAPWPLFDQCARSGHAPDPRRS